MVRTSKRQKTLLGLRKMVQWAAVHWVIQDFSCSDAMRRVRTADDDDPDTFDLLVRRWQREVRRVREAEDILVAVMSQLYSVMNSRYLSRGTTRMLRVRRSNTFETYLHMSDDWFKQMCRMNHTMFDRLHDRIKGDPVFSNNSNHPQSPSEYQLVLTLRRLGMSGNGVSVGQMAQHFSVSEGTVELWTLRCIAAISRQLGNTISWPDRQERRKIAAEVGRRSPFPDCVGFVDGTAVPLEYKPGLHDAVDFYSYKGFYSLAMMAVCDQSKKFRYVLLGFPGSAHDARVWGFSPIANRPNDYLDQGQWIMGDSAFPLGDHMVTPFKRPRGHNYLSADKHRFNQKLASSRVVVEHAFGLLKMRWQSLRRLRTQIDCQLDLDRALHWLRTCVILHNFMLEDDEDDFWDGYDMVRLYRQFEAEAADVENLWHDYIDGDGEPGNEERRDDDRKRQFIKTFAEDRAYQSAYVDLDDL